MGRRFRAGVLALGLLLSLTACGGEETPPPSPSPTAAPAASALPSPSAAPVEFTLACYPAAGFHPILGMNRTNLSLAGLMYDGLYELDGTFTPRPALAAGGSVSEDGLTWTFSLRQGVTFSDGSPLTPADVVRSLELARGSALYAGRLAQVTAVRAGEGSVIVTLSSPNGALPALLDVPVIREQGEGTPLGTGYYVLEGSDGERLLRRREGNWRGEYPARETIPLHEVEEASDLIYAFDTGELSLIGADFTGLSALGFTGRSETLDYPTADMLFVGVNTVSGPCREAEVRRALSRGMDRETLCSAILSRHAEPSALPVHPGAELYDEGAASALEYAPQELAALLTGAGWSKTDGVYRKGHTGLELTLVVNQDNSYKTGLADELARSLTSAGAVVTVKRLPWDEYLSALQKGKFDLYLGEVKLTADFDPSPLLSGGALNYGGYSDPGTAALLSAFRSAQGEARKSASQALWGRLAEQVPFTTLCFKNWSVLTQWGQVSGLTPTQQNLFYQFGNWNFAD